MPARRSAQSLVVKSTDGRPVKVEGNPWHPLGVAGTDVLAQASILNLYDPDRAVRFVQKGNQVSREQAVDFLAAQARELAAGGGDGVCFLMEQSCSLSRERLQTLIGERYPKARWFVWEPWISAWRGSRRPKRIKWRRPRRQRCRAAPFYRLDQARVDSIPRLRFPGE